MLELYKQLVANQFEAALAMLNSCIVECKPEHWEGTIANSTFRQIAYHTLFFVDLYLSTEESFQLRELHQRGGDQRGEEFSPGLSKDETLEYLQTCRQKMLATIAAETAESLAGPSGFSYRKIPRGELHLYNLRHVQHHTGALSAYLRRVDATAKPQWVGSGWK